MQVEEGIEQARTIEDEGQRAYALVGLGVLMSGEAQREVVGEAFEDVRTIGYRASGVETLVVLAPHLSEAQMGEVLAAVRTIEDEGSRGKALLQLAPHLSEGQMEEEIEAGRTTEDEGNRAYAIVGLAAHMRG